MEEKVYRTLYQGGSGVITEKKSRFIATLECVASEEEALEFIAKMKKQYWDASHNCYAFAAGLGQPVMRCSDDGEPNGTAGRPMLAILQKEELYNAAVVVTRYFGGTLLGTGGLVRAYQSAVLQGIKNSIIIERRAGLLLEIETDYNGIGKIQYILAKDEIPVLDTQYTDRVRIKALLPAEKQENVKKEITEGTRGCARLQEAEIVEYALIDKKVKIYEKK